MRQPIFRQLSQKPQPIPLCIGEDFCDRCRKHRQADRAHGIVRGCLYTAHRERRGSRHDQQGQPHRGLRFGSGGRERPPGLRPASPPRGLSLLRGLRQRPLRGKDPGGGPGPHPPAGEGAAGPGGQGHRGGLQHRHQRRHLPPPGAIPPGPRHRHRAGGEARRPGRRQLPGHRHGHPPDHPRGEVPEAGGGCPAGVWRNWWRRDTGRAR